MEKLLRTPLLVILLAGLFSPLAPIGCKSPEHAAYVATVSVTETVDAAIGAFDDYSQTHAVPNDQVLKVRKAALSYKLAVENAKIAQRTFAAMRGTPGEQAARAKFDRSLSAVEVAIGDVTKLIYEIAPELQRKK